MHNEGKKTFLAGAAIEARRRVKLVAATTTSPPEVEHAGAGEAYIGVTEYAVGSGEIIAIKLKNNPGTVEIEAATAAAIGASLYGAANGMVGTTSSGSVQATAMETVVVGQHAEVLPV